jgi:predicted RNA methylase
MFDKDFYPTPPEIIAQMLMGCSIEGKTILEPSAGKGDIVDFCIGSGAAVLACEKNPELRKLVASKCKVIADDFLTVKSDQVSHIDMIVMNPPFSADEKHILHAWDIAPDGCEIIALCNHNILSNRYTSDRQQLASIVQQYGSSVNLKDAFSTAERKTYTDIGLVRLRKPGEANRSEFEGFFTEEEPAEGQFNGIMPYNFVRDLVNRYVAAVGIFDEQLEAGNKMNNLLSGFYKSDMAFMVTDQQKPITRNDFKKDLQKKAWMFVFNKMNMQKHTTKGLKEDINKFVEQQTNVPFSMRNIYRMLEIVIGTQDQRMDRAILEVFDRLTTHYHDNRYNVEGWKTNSHYLFGRKFILPHLATVNYSGTLTMTHSEHYSELIEDLLKALCYVTGRNYDEIGSLWAFLHKEDKSAESSYRREYVKYYFNTWYDWGFFRFKGFKKGTMHFQFLDLNDWAILNQRIAKLKGYPLPESIKKASK